MLSGPAESSDERRVFRDRARRGGRGHCRGGHGEPLRLVDEKRLDVRRRGEAGRDDDVLAQCGVGRHGHLAGPGAVGVDLEQLVDRQHTLLEVPLVEEHNLNLGLEAPWGGTHGVIDLTAITVWTGPDAGRRSNTPVCGSVPPGVVVVVVDDEGAGVDDEVVVDDEGAGVDDEVVVDDEGAGVDDEVVVSSATAAWTRPSCKTSAPSSAIRNLRTGSPWGDIGLLRRCHVPEHPRWSGLGAFAPSGLYQSDTTVINASGFRPLR